MNIPTDHPFRTFLADCETLLERHGKAQGAFVGGTFFRGARVFDSPGLKVSQGDGKRLDIEIKYVNEGHQNVTTNPVFCRDVNGEVYRTHGEWHFGKERVRRLLAGETPDTPIRIGRSEKGWSVGLD